MCVNQKVLKALYKTIAAGQVHPALFHFLEISLQFRISYLVRALAALSGPYLTGPNVLRQIPKHDAASTAALSPQYEAS
jgi:hypothetical protein